MVRGANIILWLLLFYSSNAEEEVTETGVKDKCGGQRPVRSALTTVRCRIPSPRVGTVGPSLATYGWAIRMCPQLLDEDTDATDMSTPAGQTAQLQNDAIIQGWEEIHQDL